MTRLTPTQPAPAASRLGDQEKSVRVDLRDDANLLITAITAITAITVVAAITTTTVSAVTVPGRGGVGASR